MNIVKPIFDNLNKMIQIINSKPWLLKICYNANNTENPFYLYLKPHNP